MVAWVKQVDTILDKFLTRGISKDMVLQLAQDRTRRMRRALPVVLTSPWLAREAAQLPGPALPGYG